jgi:transcriptional regulator with XRE-family HTH domain
MDDETPNPDSPVAQAIQALVAKGYTLNEVGRRLGIPSGRISRWSRGIGTDSADDAFKLSEFARRARPRARAEQRLPEAA